MQNIRNNVLRLYRFRQTRRIQQGWKSNFVILKNQIQLFSEGSDKSKPGKQKMESSTNTCDLKTCMSGALEAAKNKLIQLQKQFEETEKPEWVENMLQEGRQNLGKALEYAKTQLAEVQKNLEQSKKDAEVVMERERKHWQAKIEQWKTENQDKIETGKSKLEELQAQASKAMEDQKKKWAEIQQTYQTEEKKWKAKVDEIKKRYDAAMKKPDSDKPDEEC